MNQFLITLRRSSRRRETGQLLVLLAALLPVLLGATGLMVDLTLIARTHARLQAVAAAAARAGGQQVSADELANSDTFVLAADVRFAQTAADQVCQAYRADTIPDLRCRVDVHRLAPDDADWSPARRAAWNAFLAGDPTHRLPGYTVHGAVTVTAQQQVRLFFMPVLTREPMLDLAAQQTAILVTGV